MSDNEHAVDATVDSSSAQNRRSILDDRSAGDCYTIQDNDLRNLIEPRREVDGIARQRMIGTQIEVSLP